jgi:hypothetical protein
MARRGELLDCFLVVREGKRREREKGILYITMVIAEVL